MSLSSLTVHRMRDRLKARKLSPSIEKTLVTLTLAPYAALLAYVIPRHEPWADEAQAWELAKSLSLKSLFGTYIHYECSPGLWHFLLWMLARLHMTYYGMHWFTAAIALISMAILLLSAPFPLFVRLLLPFTYFFAFQYAVVARSYTLFPAILFAIAYVWPRRREHPIALGCLLGCLANVALHGTVVAIGLGLILLVEWHGTWKVKRSAAPGDWSLPRCFRCCLDSRSGAWRLPPTQDGWCLPSACLPPSQRALRRIIPGCNDFHFTSRSLSRC